MKNTFLVILLIFVLLIFLRYVLRYFTKDHPRTKDFTGSIHFSPGKIELVYGPKHETLLLDRSLRIRLHSDGYRGKQISRNYFCNGLAILELTTGKSGSKKLIFFIRTQAELNQVIAVVKSWYRSGIPIEETAHTGNGKALLLQLPGNYADWQRLKEETGVQP